MNRSTLGNTLGIDISKDKLDLARRGNANVQLPATLENTPLAHQQLCNLLLQEPPDCILIEATGGYERPLVAALIQAKLPVVLINPRQVRDFAKATGQLAKTDAIDADILAHFAQIMPLPQRPLPDQQTLELQDLLARYRQLIDLRTAETNRLDKASSARVRRSIETSLTFIATQLDDLDRQLGQLIEQSPAWAAKAELLKSVKGIGDQATRTLLAQLPELGQLTRQQVARLVGVAPINRDSGKSRGQRTTFGGRATLRSMLYMPTLCAVRCNPQLKTFYQRLRAAGKPAKLALIAAMRKLLITLNAILRDEKHWIPKIIKTA